MPDSNPAPRSIQAIRELARRDVEQGAITANYGADKSSVVQLLNEALATEIVCTLRYKRHYLLPPASPRSSCSTRMRRARMRTGLPIALSSSVARRTSILKG